MGFSSSCDPLWCQEDHFAAEQTEERLLEKEAEEDDEGWEEGLSSLLAKEEEASPGLCLAAGESYFGRPRKSVVDWVLNASAFHGFSVQTALLAVNYLDRCFLTSGGLRLMRDKPWMGRLAAVACLSLAAKMEETRVPLSLDLQAPPAAVGEEAGFLFEGRTVKRMELLVLSTLGWRMSPVTPLCLVRLFLLGVPAFGRRRREVFLRCEAALMAVIADCRWVLYAPSVWAAAVLLNSTPPGIHLPLDLLHVSKENLGHARKLILELTVAGDDESTHRFLTKRKLLYYGHRGCDCCCSPPPSPNAVVGSCFSCDSWAVCSSSASSSPEQPPFKKPNTRIDGDAVVERSIPIPYEREETDRSTDG